MYEIKYRDQDSLVHNGPFWIREYCRKWDLGIVKFNTYVKGRIGWQGLRSDEFIEEGPFLVTGTDFRNSMIDWNNCYHIDIKRFKEAPSIHLKNGDLLITKDGTIGKLAIVDDCPNMAILNSGIFVTRCINDEYITKFFYYVLSSKLFEDYYRLNSTGSTIKHLYQETFVNLKFPIPEISEQRKISNFLDIKTAQFDLLISKKEQLIKKLEEAKKSLISELVTGKIKIVNGELVLRDNLEMKDSGVEWMGAVPKYWNLARPSRICDVIRGNCSFQKDNLKEKGDYIALQYGKTYKVNEINEEYKFYVDKSFYKKNQVVEKGYTILVSTSETMEDLGHSCYYNRNDLGLLGGEQMCLKPNEMINGKFLYHATCCFHLELNQYASGLKVYRFKTDDLKRINMVIPPIEEQIVIAEYLDEKDVHYDLLINKNKDLISKLKQAKQSLISEAVTGKIDLRDWEIIEEGEIQ